MTPKQLARQLDQLEHVLCDLPPDVREPVDQVLGRLEGAYLMLYYEVRQLRRTDGARGARQVWRWLRRVNLS